MNKTKRNSNRVTKITPTSQLPERLKIELIYNGDDSDEEKEEKEEKQEPERCSCSVKCRNFQVLNRVLQYERSRDSGAVLPVNTVTGWNILRQLLEDHHRIVVIHAQRQEQEQVQATLAHQANNNSMKEDRTQQGGAYVTLARPLFSLGKFMVSDQNKDIEDVVELGQPPAKRNYPTRNRKTRRPQ